VRAGLVPSYERGATLEAAPQRPVAPRSCACARRPFVCPALRAPCLPTGHADAAQAANAANAAAVPRYSRGDTLFREGEDAHEMFILTSGRVQVALQGKDGKVHNIGQRGAGECWCVARARWCRCCLPSCLLPSPHERPHERPHQRPRQRPHQRPRQRPHQRSSKRTRNVVAEATVC
jgi:hypothetical protein